MTKEKKSGLFSWFKRKEQPKDNDPALLPDESHALDKAPESAPINSPSDDNVLAPENNVTLADLEMTERVFNAEGDSVQRADALSHYYPDDATDAEENDLSIPVENEAETVTQPPEKSPEEPRYADLPKPEKIGFFSRLKKGLFKTKQNLGSGFFGLFQGKKIDDDLFEELEEQLLIADVGVSATTQIIRSLTEHASRKQLKDSHALYELLKTKMRDILHTVDKPLDITGHKPFIILMVGVNGVGKTTTIGKLARQFQQAGKSVMLAAGDTFRAAAVEQLQVWGERNHIPVVAQHSGADAASVIFDAMQSAKSKNIDVLIADTAGRLQNKSHLMDELSKIVRVMKKFDPEAPHEILITLDAGTGQNAVSQVKLFNEAVGLNGIVLTKLDGTAKGGVIFSLAEQFAIPIRYIGVGEHIDDLRAFNADEFIDALFEHEEDKTT